MKKLASLTLFAALFAATSCAATAAEPAAKGDLQPRTDSPIASGLPGQMTIRDCLSALVGLQLLDGHRVIVAQGKPNESVETMPYKLPGRVRDAISHDIFVLGAVQQEAQAADRRIRTEVGDAKAKPDDVAARIDEYVSRPCKAELDKIADADLKLDENEIPGTVLAAIWKIRVK